MMIRAVAGLTALLSLTACGARQAEQPSASPLTVSAAPILDAAAARYLQAAQRRDPHDGYPRFTDARGAWQATPLNEWTSGFFPGVLWYLYAHSGKAELREQADRWTTPLLLVPRRNIYTHDLGFQYMSSFGLAYRLTGEERFRHPILQAARLLAARFDAEVGAIKSWNWTDPQRPFPVIADNMMNLELLFWAARQPDGDARWRDIAVQHARTTLKHHVRADGGSYHVVVFDPAAGRVIERSTHQGYADESTWARGQAWLLYGFTMAYRETADREFLAAAQRVADYFIAHLPEDRVPCWDFQAPGCPATARRDASAAAIAAAGLLELGTFTNPNTVNNTFTDTCTYTCAAERILASLSSPTYFAASGDALIQHAVGNHPAGTEIDVGLIYGDYYFVEALTRLRELRGGARTALLPRPAPRTFTWRGELLRDARDRLRREDPALRPALDALVRRADSTLTVGPFTVTAKQRVPPSGDKRDYVSYGPYWWPDSTKPNGLPYIRRDGVVNQELRRESDVLRWYAFLDAVETLAHAHYFTDASRYAERAALLLRTWFVDPATRMNPHMQYGQAIPGVTEGRGIGIIDTRDMGRLLDALTLLRGSGAVSRADELAITQWLAQYADWLANSAHGKDEADEANNHGTWYDVQRVALALFLGDTAQARSILEHDTRQRIAAQIDSAGRQPLELSRTRSLHYSVENLDGMTRLAEMGRHVDVDLWPSLRAAIDYVARYADPQNQWPGQQITAEAPDLLVPLLRRARVAYADARYREALGQLDARMLREHRTALLYPEPARIRPDTLLGAARLAALPRAERGQWERYLADSRRRAEQDRAHVAAELRAARRSELAPAPAGPGFVVTREMTDAWFRTAEARRMADALITYQTPAGGWSKRIAFTRPRVRGESFSSEDDWSWIGTLDNGATTAQLEFLGSIQRVQPGSAYQRAFLRGVDYLLHAQLPVGCWPQIYPLAGGYHDAITFNDDATVNALRILDAVATGEHAFVPHELQEMARQAVARGVDCIVQTQVGVNGFKAVWGAQHDPLTLQPVKARAYEHPSLSGRESAAILDFLMRRPAPDSAVQAAVHAAARWFRAHAIRGFSYVPRGVLTPQTDAGPLWARFYEVGTNRPIFSDRDGVVRYQLSEIGEERRRGYLWYTDEPISTLRRYQRWASNYPEK